MSTVAPHDFYLSIVDSLVKSKVDNLEFLPPQIYPISTLIKA